MPEREREALVQLCLYCSTVVAAMLILYRFCRISVYRGCAVAFEK